VSSVGQRQSHESAVGHVTGRAIYTDEQRPPLGLLSVCPVLAPHARARILKINCAAAQALSGCVAVLTATDVLGENDTGVTVHDEILLPTEEVTIGDNRSPGSLQKRKLLPEQLQLRL
jgi:xanthine dehydrogenase large subunit